MQVGLLRRRRADRVDHDHRARGLRKPVVVGVGRRGRRVRAPHHDAARIPRAARIEAGHGAAVHVVERDVAGLVADRVGVDLGCTQPPEEPRAEREGDHRAGARVVGVQDRVRAGLVDDGAPARCDLGHRLVPADRREPALALGTHPAQRCGQPRLRIEVHAVVADRALAAELAAADRVVGVAAHRPDGTVADGDEDAAGVVAIPRAGGQHASGRSPRQSSRHRRRPPLRPCLRPAGDVGRRSNLPPKYAWDSSCDRGIRPLEWSRRRQPWPPVASAGLTGPACLPPAARYALPRFTGRPRPASMTPSAAPAAARRWPVPGRTDCR